MQTTTSNSIYIANISWNVTHPQLENFLEGLNMGIHDVKLVMDRETGRSRGFAFVKVIDAESVHPAISVINGKVLDGRPLVAREAIPPGSSAPASSRPRREGRPAYPDRDENRDWSPARGRKPRDYRDRR